ncbi:MAG TPA: hypothetical protein VFH59_17745 [Frateuria sp.]|nr:hypothetical protein [Frateuria sp.]
MPLAGATEGLATAAPKGLAGAFAKMADLSNDFLDTDVGQTVSLALPFARAAHNVMTPEMRENANAATKAAAEWAATGSDPRKTGTAGRILTGTTEGLTLGLAGGAVAGPWGAAGLLGATEGYAGYKEAKAQGVDETTAREQGGITGITSAIGAFLPLKYGKDLWQTIVGGTAANVTLGAAQRGLTSKVLEDNGYRDMAAQYRIFDGEAMTADLILGAAFGWMGHYSHGAAKAIDPADVDAAAAVATEEHFNRSAPGVPTDPGVATLHADTMAASLRALHDGEMPSIPADAAQQIVDNVAPDPMHDVAHALHEAAQLELPGFESAAADIRPTEPAQGDMALPWSQQSATKGVPLDDFHDALLGDLVHNFGDEVYEYRTVHDVDGMHVEPITYRQLAEQMQQQRDEIELFGKLHEVAAACFIRNGMGTNLLPTIRMEGPSRHWND